MQATQESLVKANELLSHYSQYLPDDYFNYEDDESDQMGLDTHKDLEMFASKSLSAISGFFSKIKNTFEESKKQGGAPSSGNGAKNQNKKKDYYYEEDDSFNTTT